MPKIYRQISSFCSGVGRFLSFALFKFCSIMLYYYFFTILSVLHDSAWLPVAKWSPITDQGLSGHYLNYSKCSCLVSYEAVYRLVPHMVDTYQTGCCCCRLWLPPNWSLSQTTVASAEVRHWTTVLQHLHMVEKWKRTKDVNHSSPFNITLSTCRGYWGPLVKRWKKKEDRSDWGKTKCRWLEVAVF